MILAELLAQTAEISAPGDDTDLGRIRADLFGRLRAFGWGPSLLARGIPGDAESAESDGAVLAAFVRNEVRAFDVLFNRHASKLNGYARRWLHGADADDAVQDAFLVLFEKAPALVERDDLNVAGYLYVTLRHKICRALARREIPDPDPAAAEPSPEDDGFAALLRREEAGRLARLLEGTCNPLEQNVMMLDLEDRADAEISSALGITPGHVRVARHHAIRKLRRALETLEEG